QRPPRPLRRASGPISTAAPRGCQTDCVRAWLATLPAMLKIWGRISSLNVRKVVLAAQELALAFERVDAGGAFGIVRTPDYLARTPRALVPRVGDEQPRLWEATVMGPSRCAPPAPAPLSPLALPRRFDAERWMDWQQTTLNPAGRDAFLHLIRTPED